MPALEELLNTLKERQVSLWVDGQALRFRGEAGALDPALLAQLRRHKKDLIAHLSQTPAPRPEEGRWEPLSIGQQALYFLHVTQPHSPAYNVASAARISSTVDVEAMRSAFQALISRHEALRTTFEVHQGQPRCQIHPRGVLDFEHIEVPGGSDETLHAEVRRLYQLPFRLETGPLLRVRLLSRSETEHVFLMALHHIVFDAWSLWLVQDEFRQLYQQSLGGEPALFPALEAGYSDYAAEQEALKTNEEGRRLWAYWKDRLKGELIPPELPTDIPRSDRHESGGATHRFRISADLTTKLRALGRSQGATPFVVLLSIFKVLLHRYTGQEDLIVGTTTSGRDKSQYRRVVGYFVNTLPVRTELSPASMFVAYLKHTKIRTLEAIEHQKFPFPLLVDRLNPRRDRSRQPICPVMFSLQKPQQFSEVMRLFDENAGPIDWGGLEAHPFDLDQQEGQFELSLDFFETNDSFLGALKYDPGLYTAQTAERLARHFVRLAEGIAANPNRPIEDYELLSDEERAEVLRFGESGAPIEHSEPLVHRLFEKQAQRTPHNVALVSGHWSLTYDALNRRANQMARLLQAQGVREGSRVGCRLERMLDAPVLLLGILKAGATYVPLDPASPNARLRQMLKDSRADLLITQSSLSAEEGHGLADDVPQLQLDEIRDSLARYPETNLKDRPSPGSLAYLLYTSGSTGTPKGVGVSHAALAEHILGIREAYGLVEADRVLQFSSFTFDPVFEQLFAPWSLGAAVVLRGPELCAPAEFWEFVESQKLTVIDLPPSYLRQCNDVLNEQARIPKSLRLLIVGGDVFPGEILETWKQSGVRILNCYGPTETVITATIHDATDHDFQSQPRVPIGRPKRGLRAYVLDPGGHPVPIGVPGELYLGGSPLAEGYWQEPEQTAQKFVADPFTGSGRMYRTGDRAAWRADGKLDYLGRHDGQVKLHGIRIETGEIEAALHRCPQVRLACVRSRTDAFGETYLVAWIQPAKEMDSWEEILREHLKRNLPSYAIPRQFVPVSEFPVNTAGKIDVSALPEPVLSRPANRDYVPPRNEIESVLARIWTEVLLVESVGVNDDFFDLGGGSLSSLQIAARARDAGLTDQGLPLRPELLFECPSVAELAARLENHEAR